MQAAHKIGIDGREGDRGARRIWDEIEKMFTHADSFYFSSTVDLTNSVPVLGERYNSPTVCWRSANSRFFWNEFLLKELIELEVKCNFSITALCGSLVGSEYGCKIEFTRCYVVD